MTQSRTPISFRDAGLESQLAMRTPEGQSRSLIAKEALDRYFRILAYEAGSIPITAREWVVLKIALADRSFQAAQALMLDMSVYNSFEAGELAADWDVSSVMAFMDKLNTLGRAQQWAIIDVLERWRVSGDWFGPPSRG